MAKLGTIIVEISASSHPKLPTIQDLFASSARPFDAALDRIRQANEAFESGEAVSAVVAFAGNVDTEHNND